MPTTTGQIAQQFPSRNTFNLWRLLQAVIPEQLQRRHAATGRKIKADDGLLGEHEVADALFHYAFHAGRCAQFQGKVGCAQNVTSHVSQCATTEIVKAAPVERLIKIAAIRVTSTANCEGSILRDAQPHIPIQRAGHSVLGWNRSQALRPNGTIRPSVHFRYISNLTSPNHFRRLTRAFVGISLIAHLRGDTVFVGRVAQLPCFPNGAHQRLLHVNMLASFHAPHGGGGVHHVWNGDDDGVNSLGFFVQHLAKIFVLRRRFILLKLTGCLLFVHIAKGDNVFRRAALNVAIGFAASSNGGDVQFLVRRFVT